MDVQYQVAGGLEVPQQGRKCDISHWFPCGADGRTGGRADVRSRDYQNVLDG